MERMQLRACIVSFAADEEDRPTFAGVALPDGRILMWQSGRQVVSFDSEAVLQEKHPGASVAWYPDADEALNS